MTGVWIGVSVILGVLVVVAIVFAVQYVLSSSRSNQRERAFKRATVALESKRARAITAGDQFGEWEAEKQMEQLRQEYIAGKNPS